jgi:hypothetical protein
MECRIKELRADEKVEKEDSEASTSAESKRSMIVEDNSEVYRRLF